MAYHRLPAETISEIRSLLGLLSGRAIARQVGVSRGTVEAVRQGRYQVRTTAAAPQQPKASRPPRGYVRCKTCGGKCKMPCKVCELREAAERQRRHEIVCGKSTTPYRERNGVPGYAATETGFVFHGSIELIEDSDASAVILLPHGEREILMEDLLARRFVRERKLSGVTMVVTVGGGH